MGGSSGAGGGRGLDRDLPGRDLRGRGGRWELPPDRGREEAGSVPVPWGPRSAEPHTSPGQRTPPGPLSRGQDALGRPPPTLPPRKKASWLVGGWSRSGSQKCPQSTLPHSGCLPGPPCLDQACLSWQVLDSWPQGLPQLKPAPSQSLVPRRGGWGWRGQQGTEAEPGNWGPKPRGLDSVYLISGLGRSGKAWPLAMGSETSQPEG